MKNKKPLFLLLISIAIIVVISGVIVLAAPAIKKMIHQEMVNEKLHQQIALLHQRLPKSLSERLSMSVVLGTAYCNVSKFESREELQILIDELFKMPEEELLNNAIINLGNLGTNISCSFIPPDYNNVTDKTVWVLTITTMNPDHSVDTCDVLFYDRSGMVVEKTQHKGKSLDYFIFMKKNK